MAMFVAVLVNNIVFCSSYAICIVAVMNPSVLHALYV